MAGAIRNPRFVLGETEIDRHILRKKNGDTSTHRPRWDEVHTGSAKVKDRFANFRMHFGLVKSGTSERSYPDLEKKMQFSELAVAGGIGEHFKPPRSAIVGAVPRYCA